MSRRSCALGPIQVRWLRSSFASGESDGIEQESPFCSETVSRSGVAVAALMRSFSLHRGAQRTVEVVEDVVRILDAHRDAHEARQHAAVEQLLLGELGVGGGGGVDHEGL